MLPTLFKTPRPFTQQLTSRTAASRRGSRKEVGEAERPPLPGISRFVPPSRPATRSLHDESRESPSIPQDIPEQFSMLRGVDAVHKIVCTHHGPWPALFHRDFECLKIDFVQSALVEIRTRGHSLILLVIDGVVLQRSAHSLTLHAFNVKAAANLPASTGSSEKYSKLRPPSLSPPLGRSLRRENGPFGLQTKN